MSEFVSVLREYWFAMLLILIAALLTGHTAHAQVTVDFSRTPGPDEQLNTPDDVLLLVDPGGGGEIQGGEFASLGLVLATPDLGLNLGCVTGLGSPSICLGADKSATNDFQGVVEGHFQINAELATVQSIAIDGVTGGLVQLFDADGGFVASAGTDIDYTGPTPVASFESAAAINSITWTGLPEPGAMPLGLAAIASLCALRKFTP